MYDLLDSIDWSQVIPFVQDAWSSIVNSLSQLVQNFIDFMHQIVAFWTANEDAIVDVIRNVKTFVRSVDEVLSRIYYVDNNHQIWVTETPQEQAIGIEDVPARLRETLSADGRIGVVSSEEEKLIRERFA